MFVVAPLNSINIVFSEWPHTRAGLTNAGPCSEKICGAYSQDQNERPNDRVLFNYCHKISMSNFV